ncbi:hypothetical protein Tco_0675024 [Tanacetum coccineum]
MTHLSPNPQETPWLPKILLQSAISELRKKGIKSRSKLFSLKYLSTASIIELNKNPSAPKRVHFVNSIVILSEENEAEGETTTDITPEHDHNVTKEAKDEVKEVMEEDESEVETEWEVEEILEDEEEDEDGEYFNSFPTMEELTYHEWLLRILDPRGRQYNRIMTYGLGSRREPSNPNKISNFVGIVRGLKIFIGSFAYECDFMILEDTTRIIDRHLGEMAFGRPFIDKTGLVYDREEGTVMFEQNDEKITFKMPHTMEIFKQTRLMGLSTDSIPPSTYEENFGHGRTHYYQSLLIGDEYMQDEGYMRGVRHLMRLEIMDNKGEVTLYLMRRSLKVLRKFHWMILGGRFNQLLHVSFPLLIKPGEY